MTTKPLALIISSFLLLSACDSAPKNEYHENSPTAGRLIVFYDEALRDHVLNQIFTFETHYKHAKVTTVATGEQEAIQALYNDSCAAIVIERDLSAAEKKTFASKKLVTYHSIVAVTAVALLANNSAPIRVVTTQAIKDYLIKGIALRDTNGLPYRPQIVMDRLNSGTIRYLLDSVVKTTSLAIAPHFAGSGFAALEYIRQTPNTLGIVDFSGMSDKDDPYRKDLDKNCHLLALAKSDSANFEYPNQSSFKLGTYAWTRSVYVIRKSGEYSLAKGFESFVAGPKGQITFLKQGLLPSRQAERSIQIIMEAKQNKK